MKLYLQYSIFILGLLLITSNQVASNTKDQEVIDAKDASLIVNIKILIDDFVGHANGVYFQEEEILYLVTAGHVLVDSISGLRQNARILLSTTSSEELDSTLQVFSLEIKQLDVNKNFKYWKDIDIAVIRLMEAPNELSSIINVLDRTKSPITAIGEGDITICDSVYWPCWVQLFAYPKKKNSSIQSRDDIARLFGKCLAVRQHSPTFVMSYRGRIGFSGAPIFAECGENGFYGANLFGIHTTTIEWDNPDDSSCTDMVSIGACADEIFKRIQESWK